MTDATGTGVTVSVDCPVMPSLVAMMFAVPGATAMTTPVAGSTVATVSLLELQAMARPARTLLFASSVRRGSCRRPGDDREAASVTVTDATGTCVTVSVACPVMPSLVATMFARPVRRGDDAGAAIHRRDLDHSSSTRCATREDVVAASRATAEAVVAVPAMIDEVTVLR